jgi:hypothetical protein
MLSCRISPRILASMASKESFLTPPRRTRSKRRRKKRTRKSESLLSLSLYCLSLTNLLKFSLSLSS